MTATDDRVQAYAEGMLSIARAEGTLDEVSDELFRFARALDGSEELRTALTDPHLPAKDLGAIIGSLVERSAQEADKSVAEVRSTVELTEDQRTRLAAAIEKATGKAVDVKVIIDPTVLGGIVTTIGDTVIDGSVKSRLDQLKHAF